MKNMFLIIVPLVVLLATCRADKSVTLQKVEKCNVDNPVDFEVSLYQSDAGEKAFKARVNFDYDVDNSFQISMDADMWVNNNWMPAVKIDDTWCDIINKYKPWQVAKEKIQPSITEECFVSMGEYTLDSYQVSADEVADYIKPMSPAKYRATLTFFSEDNGQRLDQACVYAEFEITE